MKHFFCVLLWELEFMLFKFYFCTYPLFVSHWIYYHGYYCYSDCVPIDWPDDTRSSKRFGTSFRPTNQIQSTNSNNLRCPFDNNISNKKVLQLFLFFHRCGIWHHVSNRRWFWRLAFVFQQQNIWIIILD